MRNRESVYFAQLFYGSQNILRLNRSTRQKQRKRQLKTWKPIFRLFIQLRCFLVCCLFLFSPHKKPSSSHHKGKFYGSHQYFTIKPLNKSKQRKRHKKIWKPLPFVPSLRCFWFICLFFLLPHKKPAFSQHKGGNQSEQINEVLYKSSTLGFYPSHKSNIVVYK